MGVLASLQLWEWRIFWCVGRREGCLVTTKRGRIVRDCWRLVDPFE